MAAPTIVPSFLLRKIDPFAIYADYKKGLFSKVTHKPVKIEVKQSPAFFVNIKTDSPDEAMYVFKDKNSWPRVLVFSNQDEYKAYIDGKQIEHTCDLCLHKFTHDPERIPLYVETRTLVGYESVKDGIVPAETIKLVWGEGTYCCPDHCYTDIRRYNAYSLRQRDLSYKNAECVYKSLCTERYPNIRLKEVDPRVCKTRGGSVPYEDFINEAKEYVRTNHVIIPVKVAYESFKNK